MVSSRADGIKTRRVKHSAALYLAPHLPSDPGVERAMHPMARRATHTRLSNGHKAATIVGTRSPPADGYGQMVFFFNNQHRGDRNSRCEKVSVRRLAPSRLGWYRIIYATHGSHDPLDGPSPLAGTIAYPVHARGVLSSRALPVTGHDGVGIAIRLLAASHRDKTRVIDCPVAYAHDAPTDALKARDPNRPLSRHSHPPGASPD